MSGLWQEKRWKTTALMLALWVNVECFKQVMLRCFCSPFVRNYEEWKKVAKHWSLVQTFCRDFRMFLLTLVFFCVERVDIPAHARAAHKGQGPPAGKTWKGFLLICPSCPQPDHLIGQRTDLNWTALFTFRYPPPSPRTLPSFLALPLQPTVSTLHPPSPR